MMKPRKTLTQTQVTKFLSQHPGGLNVLLRNSGRDASHAYDDVHPPELIEEYLDVIEHKGTFQGNEHSARPRSIETASTFAESNVPPVSQVLSITEMERLALVVLSDKAVSYYHSATDDEVTKEENSEIYKSILLRPRVFVDCTQCSTVTNIVGNPLDIPIYIAPAAMAKLAHPEGEAGIAAACSKWGALQIISKNASISPSDIVKAGPDATFAWQLYVLKDIKATEKILARIRTIPQIKFIVLTLDAPFPGKREADERFKMTEAVAGTPPKPWGTESALTWTKTLEWLCTQTDLPIVLKGIQTYEDAYLATLFPCVKGIIVSNHGGRALDTTTTPVQVLLEIRKYCPQVFEKLDVLVDGGIRRGTDVVKALALGAKGVGIGRAALYGLAVGGEAGVSRTLESKFGQSNPGRSETDATRQSSRRRLEQQCGC
jgi:isopentenyl diphosphate isomerase/L-lactate dehydrogenase-like FMN-dependent dehydrogenase